jgi:hypothetical protein
MTTSTFLTKFAEKVYHDDMNVTSHLLADLKLAFFFRNLINEDMLSLFRRWASTEDRTQVPDLIFFGGLNLFLTAVVVCITLINIDSVRFLLF